MKSMTGYGKAKGTTAGADYDVEVRSVNHRFLDVHLRAGRPLLPLEARIVRAVKARFKRGRFEIHVRQKWTVAEGGAIHVDMALARSCYEELETLRRAFGIKDEIGIRELAEFKEVFLDREPDEDLEEVWRPLASAFEKALDELESMRVVEGEALKRDLEARLGSIGAYMSDIERLSAGVPGEIQARLVERVRRHFSDLPLDPDRVAQEAVMLAERADTSEEICRLKSHQERFAEFIESDQEIGKKLDFLLQEMNREINTIAAKTGNTDISQIAVEVKSEIEKMREQVQNVE